MFVVPASCRAAAVRHRLKSCAETVLLCWRVCYSTTLIFPSFWSRNSGSPGTAVSHRGFGHHLKREIHVSIRKEQHRKRRRISAPIAAAMRTCSAASSHANFASMSASGGHFVTSLPLHCRTQSAPAQAETGLIFNAVIPRDIAR